MELKFENVKIISEKDHIDESLIKLAQRLEGCYAHKSLFKNEKLDIAIAYRDEEGWQLTQKEFDEIANTGYVEDINIFADLNRIVLSEGSYTMYAGLDDIVIEEDVELVDYDLDVKRIRIGFKPGSVIVYTDYYDLIVFKVREDGFCGDAELVKEVDEEKDTIIAWVYNMPSMQEVQTKALVVKNADILTTVDLKAIGLRSRLIKKVLLGDR